MTPEEAFLQAIRENPADEIRWQMYADWLDEQGPARCLPPPPRDRQRRRYATCVHRLSRSDQVRYHRVERFPAPTGEIAVNRVDFQKLAKDRLADARALLGAKRWSAAYYLAGYAVECGLKACILARVGGEAEVIFADRRYSEKCWTHNLVQLVELAGLMGALNADMAANTTLSANWTIVKDWGESSRYSRTRKIKTGALYNAIADKQHGVLRWIKQRW